MRYLLGIFAFLFADSLQFSSRAFFRKNCDRKDRSNRQGLQVLHVRKRKPDHAKKNDYSGSQFT